MSRYRQVPLKELIIDARYQRDLNERQVDQIVDDFDERLLGVLEVSRRNGKSAVFDGQHRLAALKRLKKSSAPCLVHEDIEPSEEADLFVKMQRQRRNIRTLDRFRATLFSGDPDAIEIQRVVEEAGFKLGDSAHGENVIRSVGSMEWIYERGGAEALDATLDFIQMWKGDPGWTDGPFIKGVALFIEKYADRLPGEATDRLMTAAPVVVQRKAAGNAGWGGSGSRHVAVADELRRAAGLKGRKRTAK